MYKLLQLLLFPVMGFGVIFSACTLRLAENDVVDAFVMPTISTVIDETEIHEDYEEISEEERESIIFDETSLASEEDVALIALVTMAEAEGECEEGKRLVIDTILNRVDSEYFPDTIYDVIYQPSQFSSMWNGRVDQCVVREDICQLVREELRQRTNYDVIFFTAGKYGKYGVPMFQVGNHYFSSYY